MGGGSGGRWVRCLESGLPSAIAAVPRGGLVGGDTWRGAGVLAP